MRAGWLRTTFQISAMLAGLGALNAGYVLFAPALSGNLRTERAASSSDFRPAAILTERSAHVTFDGRASVPSEPGIDWSQKSQPEGGYFNFDASQAICRTVLEREPPASDRPTPRQRQALRSCDSEALYFGLHMKADPVKARQCAFIEAETPVEHRDLPFRGRAMLMHIYANGIGAERDLDLATHLACGLQAAPAETDGRVLHLDQLKRAGRKGRDFHFCDDITSGFAAGQCAGHRATLAAVERDAARARLTRGWSETDMRALARLERAHAVFRAAEGLHEYSGGGTLANAQAIGVKERLHDELIEMLDRMSKRRIPAYGPPRLRAADARLNAAYRKYLEVYDEGRTDEMSGLPERHLRAAQRRWIGYRDAAVAFARHKYPDLPSRDLAGWLSDKRARVLAKTGCTIPSQCPDPPEPQS